RQKNRSPRQHDRGDQCGSGTRDGSVGILLNYYEHEHEHESNRQIRFGFYHRAPEHIRVSLELFFARTFWSDSACLDRVSLECGVQGTRWRTARLRLQLDDVLLFAHDPCEKR